MRFYKYIVGFSLSLLITSSCSNILDIDPTDKIKAEDLFSDPKGVEQYMANLYYQLPIEDFAYFRNGFNTNGQDPNNGGFAAAMVTDEAVHSDFGDFFGDGDFGWWEPGYKLIRDVNLLSGVIPDLDITSQDRARLQGESAFLKAFAYFGLAKRYGGVPLIKESQQYSSNPDDLKVPRSTEKETWDYILQLCDEAISNLGEEKGRRANKWTAYALKSRAALHAASLAKFGSRAPMSGVAVSQGLVGLNAGDANAYYQQCIEASIAVINSGKFNLYKPNPSSPAEAAENYRQMFQDPNIIADDEAIMIKGYTLQGNFLGHNYDIWYQPAQVANGWPHPGRMNPSLDFVDIYENYNNPGHDAPIITTVDGNITDYNGYTPSRDYLAYNHPYDIFDGKDARLWGTAILPGTEWKGIPIIIQAGYIKPGGQVVIRTTDQVTVDGQTYYSYGAAGPSQYSGFDTYGGNNTRSGFSFKKFMNQNQPIQAGWNNSTTDFVEFRYAEILLNYAEAVVESGLGDASLAATYMNATRRRAAHTVDIPLTVENVQRERRVELSFENKRFWDLIRRREYHTQFNNRMMHALMPIRDLRALPEEKYIFLRVNVQNTNPKTFQTKAYYRPIPGVASNGAIQNPEY